MTSKYLQPEPTEREQLEDRLIAKHGEITESMQTELDKMFTPAPTFGDVGQGPRGDLGVNDFDPARLDDHAYWLSHKAEALAALAGIDSEGASS